MTASGGMIAVIEVVVGGDLALGGPRPHQAYARSFEGKLLVNCGSVGLPFDGDWRAAFATLAPSGTGWQATLRRVAYDRDAVISECRSGDNPEGARFAKRLETAAF